MKAKLDQIREMTNKSANQQVLLTKEISNDSLALSPHSQFTAPTQKEALKFKITTSSLSNKISKLKNSTHEALL
jgi:hypothetical protein